MDVVESVLIFLGDAVRWLCSALAGLFGTFWAGLDTLLNPLLSPIVAVLNRASTLIGDLVYAVLGPLPVWLGLTLISAAAGVVMLIAFRYLSNQEGIARAKDKISANLLAIKLYKDELRVMFKAQWGLLCGIARLQWYMLTPVVIMLVPMMLGLAQMAMRYQWRPVRPAETVLIRMRLDGDREAPRSVDLESSLGFVVDAGPVPGGGLIVWRGHGGAPGRHTLAFRIDGTVVTKELVVGDSFERVSAVRPGASWTTQLLHPGESRLPADTPVRSIEILYPSVESLISGADWWVLYFFVVSMITALLLRPVFRVTF